MAEFQKKNWLNAGDQGANDSNSVLNKENLNDLENRISKLETGLTTLIEQIDVLKVPKEKIQTNADFDDIKTAGVYTGAVDSTMKNAPISSGSFKMIVLYHHSESRIQQIYLTNTLNCDTYVRYNTGSWGPWYKLNMTSA